MKKHTFYAMVLLCITLNQALLHAAKKSIHDYLNEEAQRIANTFCSEAKFDPTKAVNICSFLNENARFAAFPVNTCITIRNRQYIKTKNTIYGNWCIVLPKNDHEEQVTQEAYLTKLILRDGKKPTALTLQIAQQQFAFCMALKKLHNKKNLTRRLDD